MVQLLIFSISKLFFKK